ncbi:MAG TPA: phosphotyrosine protein phosphatase [Candidatus Woesearchaeota archaeon]|nr:phosphotyrosine protein phosphatase [Candidatus Woesearchaeota archaeon]
MRLLFVCNQGKHKSRTAANLFKDKDETRYAGLFSLTPVSKKDVDWAELIIVMEDFQQDELQQRFPDECLKKRIASLGIPDIYYFGQPELVKLIKEKMKKLKSEL